MSQEEVLSHAAKCSVAEGSYLNDSENGGFKGGCEGSSARLLYGGQHGCVGGSVASLFWTSALFELV